MGIADGEAIAAAALDWQAGQDVLQGV